MKTKHMAPSRLLKPRQRRVRAGGNYDDLRERDRGACAHVRTRANAAAQDVHMNGRDHGAH